ncbi:MAG: hypothetical protein ACE5HT_04515 [Gemmatimonadales bacterium]
MTILMLTVVTVLLASAFVRARAEHQVARSNSSTVDALAVAQSGLQRFLAYYDSLNTRPGDGDSLRINVPDGYADVVTRVVRSPADTMEPEIHIVRSTGHVIMPTTGAEPQAERTIAQFAQWQSAGMKVTGGLTTANGLNITAGNVVVVGVDQCGAAPSVAGLRVTSSNSPSAGDFGIINGSPPIDAAGGGSAVADDTGINWAGIVAGQFEADYSTVRLWDGTYPSMLITGDLILNDAGGYGLLIVTGDLTLTGTFFSWRGVVLVGGELTANTWFTIVRGTTVTGLNEALGMNPPVGQLGGGSGAHYFEYFDCEIKNALGSLIGFVPIENAWFDNWATY